MDKGRPFRVPQPTERRVASNPEPTQRQPEAMPAVKDQPSAIPPVASSRRTVKPPKSSKRFIIPGAILLLLVIGVVGWLVWSKAPRGGLAIDSSKYQAVFFTNGQVYFGKLQSASSDYLKLTDIYYLKSQQASGEGGDSSDLQTTSNDQGNVQLIKLGNEIHGPEDQMIISKDQVLFYENLKSSGTVAQSIEKSKK